MAGISNLTKEKRKRQAKKQKMAIAAKLGAERKAGIREESDECGKTSKMKNDETDSRGIATKINLVKNKLRSAGLKMSYEPEGEILGEEESDRENDKARERGDWRPRSQRPPLRVGKSGKGRSKRIEDDGRYGTPRSPSGEWKFNS
jgi:hypothetical protein